MAVTALKTWVAGEVLTASDLNNEFLHVYDNGESLGWPATVSKDFDGNILILDSDGDTTITADTDDRIDVALSGVDLFGFDGTVSSPVNGIYFTAASTGNATSIDATGSDTNIDIDLIPKGTGIASINGTEILVLGSENSAQNILASQVFA